MNKLLLSNARVVLPDRTIGPASVLIDGSLIAAVGDTDTENIVDANVVDLAGHTLFSGFIDIHIHGAVGVDAMAANPAGLRQIGEFLARQGVTAWLPTTVPAPLEQYKQTIGSIHSALRHRASENSKGDSAKVAARVLGVHYEGPFVNSEQCGALHREYFRIFTGLADLDDLPTIQNDGAIHMMTLAPEISGGIELVRELCKRNWVVSIGHTRAEAAVLDKALVAGARHMTHFMNAMTPLHHRSLGAVGWGLVHDQVSCDLIGDGIHIDPSILKLIVSAKTAQRISLISDAIAAAGQGDGEYQIWGETITVKNGRTRNARGSIAGSVISILDAARLMLSLGFAEQEVAVMASLNPARLLGIDHECGSIQAGKRADLVAIDGNGKVRLTVIGGQIAFQP